MTRATVVVNGRFLTQSITGVQRFAREIVARLASDGLDVIIVAPPGPLRHARLGSARVIQVGRFGGHLWEQLELPRWLVGNGGSLLLSLGNTGPVQYKNQVVCVHDIAFERVPESYSWKFRALYRALIPALLGNARGVLTVSAFSAGEIRDRYRVSTDIRVVYNAPASQLSAGGWADRTQSDFFLTVGSMNRHKNVVPMARRFSRWARDSGNAARLVVVGGVSGAFASQRDQLNELPGVEVLGRVPDEKLAALYASARGFIFPSRYEGFGLPPLEAAAAGCAVIASNIPAIEEVLGDAYLAFDPDTFSGFESQLEALWDDATVMLDLSERGAARARHFSWDQSAMTVRQYLLGLIDA